MSAYEKLEWPSESEWETASEDMRLRYSTAISTILDYCTELEEYPVNIGEFIRWYVDVNQVPGKPLRALVFFLTTVKQVIPFSTLTAEFLWQFILCFGATNVHDTCAFVARINETTLLVPKLGKLILFNLKNQNSKDALLVTQVLVVNGEVAQSLVTDAFMTEVYSIGSDVAIEIATFASKAKDVSMLRHMFPDLEWGQASRVIDSHGSVEASATYLLEHGIEHEQVGRPITNDQEEEEEEEEEQEDYEQDEENERYVSIDEFRQQDASDKDKMKSLNVALRMLEEEDDPEEQELESGAVVDQDPVSAKLLFKTEKYLWDMYSRNAEPFSRASRKSKARAEMKSVTKWTDEQIEGWARIIEKNPRRRAFLEDRFMFQGNKPYLANILREEEGDGAASETEPNEVQSEQEEPGQQQASTATTESKKPNRRRKTGADYRRQRQKTKSTQKMGL